MKLILLSLLIVPIIAFGQSVVPSIDGFLGIKFGSPKEVVVKHMKEKGYVNRPNSDILVFDGVDFLNKETVIMFKFVDNKMFEGIVFFNTHLPARVLDVYESIKSDVSMKYGEGKSYETYQYPYEKGDGYFETAFKLGKASYNTYWGVDAGESNAISLEITEALSIVLTYQHAALIEEAINKQNRSKMEEL